MDMKASNCEANNRLIDNETTAQVDGKVPSLFESMSDDEIMPYVGSMLRGWYRGLGISEGSPLGEVYERYLKLWNEAFPDEYDNSDEDVIRVILADLNKEAAKRFFQRMRNENI